MLSEFMWNLYDSYYKVAFHVFHYLKEFQDMGFSILQIVISIYLYILILIGTVTLSLIALLLGYLSHLKHNHIPSQPQLPD